jgi:hypothetical protein
MINPEAIKVINHTPTPLWRMLGVLDYLAIILMAIITVTFILISTETIDIEKLLPHYRAEPTIAVLSILVSSLIVLTVHHVIYPVVNEYLEEKNTITIQAELDVKNPKLKDIKTLYETQEKYKEQLKSKTEMHLDYNGNKPVAKMTTTRKKLQSNYFMYNSLSEYVDKEVENIVDLLANPDKIK